MLEELIETFENLKSIYKEQKKTASKGLKAYYEGCVDTIDSVLEIIKDRAQNGRED